MRRRTIDGKKAVYSLTIRFNTGVASITVNGKAYTTATVLQFEEGTVVSWSAVAATGYNLTSASGSITMDGDKELAPGATVKTYTLTVTLNENVIQAVVTVNGVNTTYTKSGSQQVNHGASVSWTATPKNGYYLDRTPESFTMLGNNSIYAFAYRNYISISPLYSAGDGSFCAPVETNLDIDLLIGGDLNIALYNNKTNYNRAAVYRFMENAHGIYGLSIAGGDAFGINFANYENTVVIAASINRTIPYGAKLYIYDGYNNYEFDI